MEIAQREVVVSPGSAPATLTLQVSNVSSVVEAYEVSVLRPPPWLRLVPGRAEFLRGQLVQSASDRRAMARAALGSAAIMLGTFQP